MTAQDPTRDALVEEALNLRIFVHPDQKQDVPIYEARDFLAARMRYVAAHPPGSLSDGLRKACAKWRAWLLDPNCGAFRYREHMELAAAIDKDAAGRGGKA